MSSRKFECCSDESNLPAADRISQFQADLGRNRNFGGYSEEITQCTRIVQTLVRSDGLTPESLQIIFKRAHQNLPVSATYLLAFQALQEAASAGNMPEVLGVVVECVMADEDPAWITSGKQEEQNKLILQKLLINPHLFELMMPYMSHE